MLEIFAGLLLAVTAGLVVHRGIKMLQATYVKNSAAEKIVGIFPRSPRPLTVDMTRNEAHKKFVAGLMMTQNNQGWAISNTSTDSVNLSAVLRWSGAYYETNQIRAQKLVKLNSSLKLIATFFAVGRMTEVNWQYEHDATSWTDQTEHHVDKDADEYMMKTNFDILRSFGLI